MCSLILNKPWSFPSQYVLLSWVFCVILFRHVLVILSPLAFHPGMTSLPRTRRPYICLHIVCQRRITWGTTPPHFYYMNNFPVCWLLLQMKETQRRTRCVGSACSLSVFFIWLGLDLGLSSVIMFYFSTPVFHIMVNLYFYCLYYLLPLIYYLYLSLSFSSLRLSLFNFSSLTLLYFLICVYSSILVINNTFTINEHSISSRFLSETFHLFSFIRLPLLPLLFFLCTVPCYCPPTIKSVRYHFSLFLSPPPLAFLLSYMSFEAVMIICRWGWAIVLGREYKAG